MTWLMLYKSSQPRFSSPKPKAQVSFSDQNLSIVRHRCCLVVVVIVVNYSHFHLLLQNHRANFNQAWHRASLGKGNSSLFKWRTQPRVDNYEKQKYIVEDNYEIAKLYWRHWNNLLENHWTNFNQTWHKASLGKENSDLFKHFYLNHF